MAKSGVMVVETWARLEEALILEPKYQPSLMLPTNAESGVGEVTMGMRDGSAQVLRCLKVWYELTPDVLLVSLNIMDRFLSRMRARPKHLSCIAVSAFHISIQYLHNDRAASSAAAASSTAASAAPPTPADLVAISQAKCTAGDVSRMCAIIGDKLGCDPAIAATRPVTAGTLVRLLVDVLTAEGHRHLLKLDALLVRLESVLCCGEAASVRSCELALALVAESLAEQRGGGGGKTATASGMLVAHLRQFCGIGEASFVKTRALVVRLVANYNSAGCTPRRYRQRLLWRLSNRTLRQLRPTTQLHSVLPTIEESRDSACGVVGGSSAGVGGASGGPTSSASSSAAAAGVGKPRRPRFGSRTPRRSNAAPPSPQAIVTASPE